MMEVNDQPEVDEPEFDDQLPKTQPGMTEPGKFQFPTEPPDLNGLATLSKQSIQSLGLHMHPPPLQQQHQQLAVNSGDGGGGSAWSSNSSLPPPPPAGTNPAGDVGQPQLQQVPNPHSGSVSSYDEVFYSK